MSGTTSTTEAQAVQPNTWTPLLGTDVEFLVDGVPATVHVEAEGYRNEQGETLAQFTLALNGQTIALRAPAHAMTWPQPNEQ